MRRAAALLLSLSLILVLIPSTALAGRQDQQSAVIVVFKDHVANPAAAAGDLGAAHGFGAHFVYQHALKGFAASVPTRAMQALSRDPRVAWVEPDQAVQLYAQTIPTGIHRIFAPGNANLDIDGSDDLRVDVDVAIIDTGIDLDHPDLNVVSSTSCLYSSGGPPFSRTYSCGAGGDDDNGHGTHVGGTVGALDNDIGVVGVAPGARLWAVKVLDANGSGSLGAVAAGIDYVTANAGAIEVANMSLGCECSSAAMDTAIANSVDAGVTYAVAAGNSDANASTHSPANHPDVITVSALADFNGQPGGGAAPTCRTDQDDTLADFSNWGSTIEIAAPGVCILSTVPGGGYDTFSGTSMASPHVAGAAALRAATAPSATPDQIRTTLINAGNLNWTDDSGDGVKERLLDVSSTTIFNPATVPGSGGGGGGGGDTTAPSVSISSPTGGTVSGTVTIQVAATDDVDPAGSLNVDVAIDGAFRDTTYNSVSARYEATWDTTTATNGSHTIDARAVDDAGNTGNAARVTVTVDNGTGGGGGDASVVHVSDLDRSSQNNGSTWTAIVTITVRDGTGATVSGVTVSGSWSNGTTGTGTCTTNSSGVCSIPKGSIAKRTGSVTFTVTNLAKSGLTYDQTANSDPDGDSNGTTITVLKP